MQIASRWAPQLPYQATDAVRDTMQAMHFGRSLQLGQANAAMVGAPSPGGPITPSAQTVLAANSPTGINPNQLPPIPAFPFVGTGGGTGGAPGAPPGGGTTPGGTASGGTGGAPLSFTPGPGAPGGTPTTTTPGSPVSTALISLRSASRSPAGSSSTESRERRRRRSDGEANPWRERSSPSED